MNTRVLILEPDTLQRDLMTLALKRHRLEPVACSTPQEALEQIAERRPGLLIIDLLLRGQNGLDFLDELKKKDLLDGLQVVAVSPLGYPEIVLKAARAGAAAFLVKPVDPDQLAEKVWGLINAAAR